MKGIILAGGSGTRLYPVTRSVSKQILPVYDKPMIFYPLSTLMMAGIRDILIISTPNDTPIFEKLLGDGKSFGISLEYKVQESPDGLAQAFILGEKFIGNDSCCLILGDNLFFGHDFAKLLNDVPTKLDGAYIFAHRVKDPERYGVVEFNKDGVVKSIEEKPDKPRSNFAVTGLYFYDNNVVRIAKKIKPSERGELEITSINEAYLSKNKLNVKIMGRGFAWLDTGTHASLLEASMFVQTVENRQGLKIACLEEIAWRNGWISRDELIKSAENYPEGEYKNYILSHLK